MVSTQPTCTHRWSVCAACQGEGRVRRKRRRNHQNALMDPCKACSATGILPETGEDKQTANKRTLRVAIIGGGIGGLALASALQHRGFVETKVYERDADYSERRQGYGLTMQQAAKQLAALGVASLSEGITSTKHIVHNADGTVLGQWGMRHWVSSGTKGTDSSNKPTSKKSNNKRQNIHIARQALRHELLEAANTMNPDTVQWNHRLIDYSVDDSGVLCRFQVDGKTNDEASRILETRVDLLVGADGIRSQVRQQLLQGYPLRYLACIVILGICPLSALGRAESTSGSSFRHLLDGETVFQTADGTTRIYMMPFSGEEYMWQLSFPIPESVAQELSLDGASALQQAALKRCGMWHSPVPDILTATPLELISGYPVYDRTILTDIPPGPVTLIGDAAHPMSPFKGQGANQALLDALSLARSLYQADVTLEEQLQTYSEEMIARTSVKVRASAEAARFLHSEVAIQKGNVTRGAAAARVDRIGTATSGTE